METNNFQELGGEDIFDVPWSCEYDTAAAKKLIVLLDTEEKTTNGNTLNPTECDKLTTKSYIASTKPNKYPLNLSSASEETNVDITKKNEAEQNNTMITVDIETIINKIPENYKSCDIIKMECDIIILVQTMLDTLFTFDIIRGTVTKNTALGEESERINQPSEINSACTTQQTIKNKQNMLLDIIQYLTWISKASEILANRIGQPIIKYKSKPHFGILRSSYNFCNKEVECKNFYRKSQLPTCTEHHYVHNMLKYDTDSVIHNLQLFLSLAQPTILNGQVSDIGTSDIGTSEFDIGDIMISIKTISFVIKHMNKEISHIEYITKNNSELFHRNNPYLFKKSQIQPNPPRDLRTRHRAPIRAAQVPTPTKKITNTRSSCNMYDVLNIEI